MSVEAGLCKSILLEDFGVHTATVANNLILKGRLTANDLARFCGYTLTRVKEVLVGLIEHGIVYFTEAPDEKREPTYYEIDHQKILMRLRMGRIMRVTEEHYGKAGSAICQLLYIYGRVRLSQVLKWAAVNDTKNKDEAEYNKAFTKMAIEQFITAVLPEHSRSIFDKILDAEEKEVDKYTIVSNADKIAIKTAAQAKVDEGRTNTENIGMKRRASTEIENSSKRAAIEIDIYDEEDSAKQKKNDKLAFEVDSDVFFVLNYEKFNLYFRNQLVSEFAASRINRTAGIVMKTFFRSGKSKMKIVKEQYSPAASVTRIANMLEPEVFSRGDIVLPVDPQDPRKKPSVNEVVQGYVDLLRSDPSGFIKLRDEMGAGQYSVNFEKVRHAMKQKLFEGLLADRFGDTSCRIIRILIDKGKLDESQIQKYSMLPPKDVRHKLDILLTAGVVEIQEVPRSADRAPSRSFHLWYVPLEKCFDELLDNVYKAITNLQIRKVEELSKRTRLIDKLNRRDVIENMALLEEIDKAEVAKMDKVIETIEVSKGRLDVMAMILRDF